MSEESYDDGSGGDRQFVLGRLTENGAEQTYPDQQTKASSFNPAKSAVGIFQ